MKDIITYIPNLDNFRYEAQVNSENNVHGFSFDDKGGVIYNITKIPVYYNPDGTRSICLVRLVTQQDMDVFHSLNSCERLGECIDGEYVFDDEKQIIYDDVRGELNYTYTDQNNVEKTGSKPYMIGVFS